MGTSKYFDINEQLKNIVPKEFSFRIAAKIRCYWQLHIWKTGYFPYKRICSIHEAEPEATTQETIRACCKNIEDDIRRAEDTMADLLETISRW